MNVLIVVHANLNVQIMQYMKAEQVGRFVGQTYGEGDATPSGATGFFSNDFFYVVPDKCTECKGFHDAPQCQEVCPVDCCVSDPDHVEDETALLKKKEHLDSIGR